MAVHFAMLTLAAEASDNDDEGHVLRDSFVTLQLRQRGTAPLNYPTVRVPGLW